PAAPGGFADPERLGDVSLSIQALDFITPGDPQNPRKIGPAKLGRTGTDPDPAVSQAEYAKQLAEWGTKQFAGLPPARYEIAASKPDYGRSTFVVDVVPYAGYPVNPALVITRPPDLVVITGAPGGAAGAGAGWGNCDIDLKGCLAEMPVAV